MTANESIMPLGPMAQTAKASATLALSAKAKQLKASGAQVFDFTAGEPDFPPPKAVIEAAHKAIDDGFHKYTPADGLPVLKNAIASWHEKVYGAKPAAAQIAAGVGAKQVIAECLMCLLAPGDEVLVPSPYWVSYPTMIEIAGGKPVFLPNCADSGEPLDPKRVSDAITPKTKAIMLNSPNNPSGGVVSEAAMREIGRIAAEKNLWIITDDIYCALVHNDAKKWFSPGMDGNLAGRTVVINGVSKSYAMTGWRIGWLVGPEHLARAVARLQGQLTSNPTAVAQVAASAALTDESAQAAMAEMALAFKRRRNLIVDLAGKVPGLKRSPPDGAFYLFADVAELMAKKGAKTDSELCGALIEKAGVVAVPGSEFGSPGRLRFSFATSDEVITKGMEALREFAST